MREKWEDALGWVVHRRPVEYVGRGVATVFPSLMEDYVAGETAGDALTYVEEDLNPHGVRGLIDLLGEHYTDESDVEASYEEYHALISEIEERDIDAELSVKLTQLGMDLYEDSETRKDACRQYVEPLAEHSTEQGQRLWIDMEDADYTDDTVEIYLELLEQDYDVGLCLQAYLERTADDIERMPDDAAIRLVKGAYDTDRELDSWEDVEGNYEQLLEQLFEADIYTAVGTHNERLLGDAERLVEVHDADRVEFQALMGVRWDRMQELADTRDVSVYVPFGENAEAYFWRRIQEHPRYLRDFVASKVRSVRKAAGIDT